MNEMKDAFLRTLNTIHEKHILYWTSEHKDEFRETEESAKASQRCLSDFTHGNLEDAASACQDFLDAFEDLQRLRRERNDIAKAFDLVQGIVKKAL